MFMLTYNNQCIGQNGCDAPQEPSCCQYELTWFNLGGLVTHFSIAIGEKLSRTDFS